MIPNLFRRLFGEGALAAAFLPEYERAVRTNRQIADQLATRVILLVALGTGLIMLIGELALLLAVVLIDDVGTRAFSLRLLMVTLPFMPLVCTSAMLGAMLQVHNRFAPTAAAPIILNVLIIAAASWTFFIKDTDQQTAAYAIGVATVLAGVIQVLWSVHALKKHARWQMHQAGQDVLTEPMGRVKKRFLPVLIGSGTIQINTLLDTIIAMWPLWIGVTVFGVAFPLDERSNAILGYTQRLYQFPLGVFGIAVATAAFPLLSKSADDPGKFASTLMRSIRLSLFIGIPASVGLALVRRDLVTVMFTGSEHAFSAAGAERSSAVLIGYATAVWAYSLNQVLTRSFYARGDTRTPMRIALWSVVVNLSLNLALIWWLAEAGLAWATATSAIFQTVVLIICTRDKLDADAPGILTFSMLRVLACTLIMSVCVVSVQHFWPDSVRWVDHLYRLIVSAGLGMVVYIASSRVLRAPEFSWLLLRK